MRLFFLAALVFGSTGCGAPPGPRLFASLHIAASLIEQVATLEIHVLGPKTADNEVLRCEKLTARDLEDRITPDDAKEQLGYAKVTLEADMGAISITEVAAGEGRRVYVAALDSAGELVGEGCVEDKAIVADETNPVWIKVYPYEGPL